MSWIGGKKALRELIVSLFPIYYERYIEVFGGGGWVLFHKPPGNDFEVYNDFNGLLVNLYRCVREKPEELMEALRFVLNAREDFDAVRAALARDSPASDVQRAAWFYQLIRYSYASGLTSFGSQPHDIRSNFPLIEQAHRRLAKVVIENKDFEKLIRQYDRPVSFFYLDPPYHATEGYYGDIYGRLEEVLGLSYQGGTRVKFTEDGKTEFRVWGLDVDIENAPLAGGDRAGNRFVANCEIELEVPVSFGGRLLPAMRITVATSAGYTPRF